jgi:hypothetical protein
MTTKSRLVIWLMKSWAVRRLVWPLLERRGLMWFVTTDDELYVMKMDRGPLR